MSNALYDKGRASFGKAEINWIGDTIRAVLVDIVTYTAVLASDQFLSDIPSGALIKTSSAFTSKTDVAGVMDADDLALGLTTGVPCGALVIYQDTGVAGTSRLIAYIDTATGLPMTPSGGPLNVAWDNGANKIFKL